MKSEERTHAAFTSCHTTGYYEQPTHVSVVVIPSQRNREFLRVYISNLVKRVSIKLGALKQLFVAVTSE